MNHGEVTFAGTPDQFSEVFDEFLAFPHGKIDGPNACAYALLLRPGAPVFDTFSADNISETLSPLMGQPLYLAANADGSVVTAALVQRSNGEVRILADWVREGSPADVVGEIYAEAMLAYSSQDWEERTIYGEGEHQFKLPVVTQVLTTAPIRWIVPALHNDPWRNVGLVQAIRAIPQTVSAPGDAGPAWQERARTATADLIGSPGRPRFLVGHGARWTLRALAGGYAKAVNKRGGVNPLPDAGIYRLLMEAVETFCAIGAGLDRKPESQQPVAYDRAGRPYASAMPAR
jgi:hypothetical protein